MCHVIFVNVNRLLLMVLVLRILLPITSCLTFRLLLKTLAIQLNGSWTCCFVSLRRFHRDSIMIERAMLCRFEQGRNLVVVLFLKQVLIFWFLVIARVSMVQRVAQILLHRNLVLPVGGSIIWVQKFVLTMQIILQLASRHFYQISSIFSVILVQTLSIWAQIDPTPTLKAFFQCNATSTLRRIAKSLLLLVIIALSKMVLMIVSLRIV